MVGNEGALGDDGRGVGVDGLRGGRTPEVGVVEGEGGGRGADSEIVSGEDTILKRDGIDPI